MRGRWRPIGAPRGSLRSRRRCTVTLRHASGQERSLNTVSRKAGQCGIISWFGCTLSGAVGDVGKSPAAGMDVSAVSVRARPGVHGMATAAPVDALRTCDCHGLTNSSSLSVLSRGDAPGVACAGGGRSPSAEPRTANKPKQRNMSECKAYTHLCSHHARHSTAVVTRALPWRAKCEGSADSVGLSGMNGQAVGPTKAFGGDYAIPYSRYTHRGSLRTALTECRRQSATDLLQQSTGFVSFRIPQRTNAYALPPSREVRMPRRASKSRRSSVANSRRSCGNDVAPAVKE